MKVVSKEGTAHVCTLLNYHIKFCDTPYVNHHQPAEQHANTSLGNQFAQRWLTISLSVISVIELCIWCKGKWPRSGRIKVQISLTHSFTCRIVWDHVYQGSICPSGATWLKSHVFSKAVYQVQQNIHSMDISSSSVSNLTWRMKYSPFSFLLLSHKAGLVQS